MMARPATTWTRSQRGRRRSSLLLLLIAGSVAACLSDERVDSVGESVELAKDAEDREASPAVTCSLPPGGLVSTSPQSGWTEGSFAVTDDGAATYTLPLWVPDGRGGLEPELALSYNSRAGNGPLGVGWAIAGLSAIRPCSRNLAQDGRVEEPSFNAPDAYCLDGQRLRPASTTPASQREFRTERETFSRIIGYSTALPGGGYLQPDSFKVWTKDGLVLTYGSTANSRLRSHRMWGSLANGLPTLKSLIPPTATAAWALKTIQDRNGNSIAIEYEQTPGIEATFWAEEMYPRRITYAPDRKIDFFWESLPRPDIVDHFQSGGVAGAVHERVRFRLQAIQMSSGGAVHRTYSLTYLTREPAGRSLLSQVQECDGGNVCLQPIEFSWSEGSSDFQEISTNVADVGSYPLSGYTFTAGDVNGDGADDLIYGDQNNVWKFRLSNRTTGFGPAQLAGIPNGDRFRRSGFRPVDFNRDGRLDLLVEVPSTGSKTKFALYRSNGAGFELQGEMEGTSIGSEVGQIPTAFFADIDGNGYPDYLAGRLDAASDQHWRFRLGGPAGFGPLVSTGMVLPYDPNAQFRVRAVNLDGDGRTSLLSVNEPATAYQAIEYDASELLTLVDTSTINLPFTNLPENADRRNLHFADVNCDGLADAIYPYTGLSAQLNTGGGFSPLIAGPGQYTNPAIPLGAEPGVRIVDFTGDGCDDVMLLHSGVPTGPSDHAHGLQLYTWRGGRFVRIALNHATPTQVSPDQIQPMDFDGDGLMDIAYVAPGSPGPLRILKHLGSRPDLLIGAKVPKVGDRFFVEYKTLADPSAHRHVSCERAGTVICVGRGGSLVSKHGLQNGLSAPESHWHEYEHHYENARVDTFGRGWLGFEQHRVTDLENDAELTTSFDASVKRFVAADEWTVTAYPFAGVPRRVEYEILTAGGEGYQRIADLHREIRLGEFPGTYALELRSADDHDDELLSGPNWVRLHSKTTGIEYDAYGSPKKITVAHPDSERVNVVQYENDPVAWLIGRPTLRTATDCTKPGNVCQTRQSSSDYDDVGNLSEIVVEPNHPEDLVRTAFSRDAYGNITSVTATNAADESRTATVTYDADKLYPRSVKDPLNHVSQVSVHRGLGVPISVTDPNGICSTMQYDGYGRLRAAYDPDGFYRRMDTLGPLQLTVTVPNGFGGTVVAQTTTRDVLGRGVEQQTLNFQGGITFTRARYDRMGRLEAASRPYFDREPVVETRYLYDNRDRLKKIIHPDGIENRFEYAGLETHHYDGKNIESIVRERSDGLIAARFEDDPRSTSWITTTYSYGPFGLLSSVKAADNTTQSMMYDRRGRRTRHVNPSTGTTTTSYNAFGDLILEENGAGEVTEIEPDLLGRPTTITSADGNETFVWDTAANGIGKLDRATSADGILKGYSYDDRGHLTQEAWTVEGALYAFDLSYDSIGRLSRLAYPVLSVPTDRLKVSYLYTSSGHVEAVCDESQTTCYWQALERNAADQIELEYYGNEVVTERTYGPTGLVSSITSTSPGEGMFENLLYDYDDNRNVVRRRDMVGPNHLGQVFTYDALNRLETWVLSTGAKTGFEYNSIGNITAEIVGTTSTPYIYHQNGAPPHALTQRGSATYSYDEIGRQIAGPNRTVEYNRFNLPASIARSGQVTEFQYDSDGSRILKRDPTETVISVAGLFERRTGTTIQNVHRVVADGRPVAEITRVQTSPGSVSTDAKLLYLHQDGQGNIIQTTSAWDGDIVEEFFYDPFGRRMDRNYQPLPNERRDIRLGYTGHDHDDELGLINMKGRIFDPAARLFLTPDPFIPDPLSSQSYNRYTYVLNNPATLIDPTGFQWDDPDEVPKHRESVETPNPPGIGHSSTAPGGSFTPFHPFGVLGVTGGAKGGEAPAPSGDGAKDSDDDNGTDKTGGGSGSGGGPVIPTNAGQDFWWPVALGVPGAELTSGSTAGDWLIDLFTWDEGDEARYDAMAAKRDRPGGAMASAPGGRRFWQGGNDAMVAATPGAASAAWLFWVGAMRGPGGRVIPRAARGATTAAGGAVAARTGTTTLFRAVSEAEFTQVMKTGAFEAGPNSLGGKFFAGSAADAAKWGEALNGAGNFKVLQVELPTSTVGQMMHWQRLDGIGPAWYGELPQLGGATITPHVP